MPLSFDDLIPQGGAPAQQAAPAQSGRLSFDDLVPGNAAPAQAGTPPKASFGLMDTWPAKLAQSIYSAVTLPGDVYQGNAAVPQSANMPGGDTTTSDPNTPIPSGTIGSLLGLKPGSLPSNIGRVTDLASLYSPLSPGGAPKVMAPPTNAMLKSAAVKSYDQALKVPIEINPKALDIFTAGAKQDMLNDGISLDVMAPTTSKIVDKLGNAPDGATVSPTNIRAIQKSFGYIKNNNSDPQERMIAGSMLNQFNKFLENLDQVPSALAKGTPEDAAQFSSLVKEGNGNYAAYKGAQAFDQRGMNAQYQSNASHSGMNLENNLRSQAAQILKNPSLQRGMSDETIGALKDFNAGSRTENTMRLLSNVLGGGGGLGMLAAASVGHMFGLPFEAGPAVGMALKGLANRRAGNEFSAIGDTIRANSPLAQQGAMTRRPGSAAISTIPRFALPAAGGGLPNPYPMLPPFLMNGT